MTDTNARGPWLVPVLVGLAAAAGGLCAGWFLRGGAARPEVPARSLERDAPDAATREQLDALEARILAQLRQLARPGADGASPATPDAAVNELGRRIDELDARIALLDTHDPRRESSSLWTPPKGPGGGSIDAIVVRIQGWYGKDHAESEGEDLDARLAKEHDLWTFEDVVRAYGEPLSWHRDKQNWELRYGQFSVEGWEDGLSVVFCLTEGYVTRVSAWKTER